VITYHGTFRFTVTPEQLWDAIEQTGDFERWWSWLGEFKVAGAGLRSGTILTGVVSPPLPYRMRVRVELEDCVRPRSIDAAIHGDLEGRGTLRLSTEPLSRPSPDDQSATTASVWWTIEMMQAPMRLAARIGYPLLCWGHDRVVDATVAGFRRQVEGSR
jgi:hypothetical protein